jgi:predicted dehydrogenase
LRTPSRRDFVSAAATAGVALRAQTGEPVRLGFIGTGSRGKALLRTTRGLPVQVAHLCDVDQNRAEEALTLAHQFGHDSVRTSADLRQVLEDKRVDAVVIATPDHWHALAAILACDAGKDVYVEKPVSHNLREGRLLVEAARRNKRIVQAGLQGRSRPIVRKAIEIVHSGRLGRVLMAKAWNTQLRKDIGRQPDGPVPKGVDYDLWVGPAEMLPFNANRFHYNWHWNWNYGTGDMGNDGAHQLDMARWALEATGPRRVSGMGRKLFFDDDQQTPDTMNITFDFGGKLIQWEMRIWTPYLMEGIDNGVAVYGSDAMMHIGDPGNKWCYRIFDRKGQMVEDVKESESEYHLRNFLDCVRTRQTPNCEIEEGHRTTTLCHLGNICARTGRNLTYDSSAEAIVGDAEAQSMTRRKYRPHWATPKGV